MPVLPIDAERYGTPEMRRIFEDESRLQKLLDVEAALAWALAEAGLFPKDASQRVIAKASTKYVTLARVAEIERATRHDVMALVNALAEVCGKDGGFVHYGATSSDILDTATALQFKDAFKVLMPRLDRLESVLLKLTVEHRQTLMVGRTHGQHALPITLGLKFAVWLREVSRHIQRLNMCRQRVLVGKMTGAVGTQAGLGPKGLLVQMLVMKHLGIKPVEVSTQIVQRDRHAELICLLALVASSIDKFASEVRELQRTEFGELYEPFDVKRQVGSSTMPHKMNPVASEQLCGLAKIMRSLTLPALENVPSWQERDLSNSSAERFIFPTAFIILDYMVDKIARILSDLKVNKERMITNLNATQGRIMSEAVMLALTRKGMSRQDAHETVRRLALKSLEENSVFKEVLSVDRVVKKFLTREEMDAALNPASYLGTALEQIDAAVRRTRLERKARKVK